MRIIYILSCNDGSLYTGITTNIERRIYEHNHSKLGAKYTTMKRPVQLVRTQEVANRSLAASYERHIKHLSKQEKQALIASQAPFTH